MRVGTVQRCACRGARIRRAERAVLLARRPARYSRYREASVRGGRGPSATRDSGSRSTRHSLRRGRTQERISTRKEGWVGPCYAEEIVDPSRAGHHCGHSPEPAIALLPSGTNKRTSTPRLPTLEPSIPALAPFENLAGSLIPPPCRRFGILTVLPRKRVDLQNSSFSRFDGDTPRRTQARFVTPRLRESADRYVRCIQRYRGQYLTDWGFDTVSPPVAYAQLYVGP